MRYRSDIVELLDAKALPYIIFFIVPVLGRMSDPDDDLRYLATNTFASLVKMVTLETGLPGPPGLDSRQSCSQDVKQRGRSLRKCWMAPKSKTTDTRSNPGQTSQVPARDGVNWLAFLAKY